MDSASSVERARAECRRQLPELLPRLGRFAIGLTRARYDADDLVQAACERALSRSDQWDPETALDSWMFRIVQTIWLNELRARKIRERHADREQADRIGTRRESSDARLLLLRTEEEIFRLPDGLRLVLLLVGVQGLSYREAADVLSIPIGTVMSRLARARLLLTERLGFDPDSAPQNTELLNGI